MSSKLDRKDFLTISGILAGGFFAGGCRSSAAVKEMSEGVTPINADSEQPQLLTLDANPPIDTKAIRYFIDDVKVSELTDLYAQQTNTKPVWKTVIDPAWIQEGKRTLRVEADTADGTQILEKRTILIPQQAVPASNIPLNGGWRFSDAKDLKEGAAIGSSPAAVQPDFNASNWDTIMVPNSLGYIDHKWNDPDGILGVYRQSINISSIANDEQISIVLESCYWSGRVFINGTEIGHTKGGYLPSRFDITDEIQSGNNDIAIITDNRKSTMGLFKRLHYFYWNWGGLLQEVYIERNPDIALTDLRAEGTLAGELHLYPTAVNKRNSDQQLNLNIEVQDPSGNKVLSNISKSVSITADAQGEKLDPLKLTINNPDLWDLENTNLYTVIVSGSWGSLKERTGFRDVETKNGDLLLNGEVVENLQGFDRHADYPGLGKTQPAALPYQELKELHDKGFRIFRPAHYPTTPAELVAADELGLLVIEEINVTGLKGAQLGTKEVQDFAAQQLTKMIHRDRSHPSIIAWSVGNENLTDEKGAREYIQKTIGLGRSLDANRLFTHVSNQTTHDETYEFQDILAQNYYAGWYTRNVDTIAHKMDDIQEYGGNKPILLTEYGAEAVPGRPGTGRGTEFYQAYVIDGHNKFLNNRKHTIGQLYWTSTEFWCRPDWSGGNPTPVPPFHVKAIQGYYRNNHKLGWRVIFSPIRMAFSTVSNPEVTKTKFGAEVTLDAEKTTEVRQQVVLKELHGKETKGMLMILPPNGFKPEESKQEFSLKPNEEKTMTVKLKGKLRKSLPTTSGYIKAVINGDTEAMPLLITISQKKA